MARRGMGLDSVVRAKILTSGISLSFVLWWWSKQPSPAQPKKLVESGGEYFRRHITGYLRARTNLQKFIISGLGLHIFCTSSYEHTFRKSKTGYRVKIILPRVSVQILFAWQQYPSYDIV